MSRVPASLRALLTGLIDYAGLYPPASLPLPIVLERYRGFCASPEAWMLNRLLLPADKLAGAPLHPSWRVSLLVDSGPGPLPRQVETIETRNPDLRSDLPVYYEGSLDRPNAKLRTGGLTADAIPTPAAVAKFLRTAADRRLPFKATAGLHHPIRSERRLTYALDSPVAIMHGFLNVFTAAALAWHGVDAPTLAALLDERDPAAFRFDDEGFRWRNHSLTTPQISDARRDFAHSFGSCSFEEPVTELREFRLLP
jgi:hypothetical protein